MAPIIFCLLPLLTLADDKAGVNPREIRFTTHDGYDLFGKLYLPEKPAKAIVMYVQTAEGSTVDMKRRKSQTETFNYYDLYRTKLAEMQIGFFSYEGRGITMGDKLPRYESIDWKVYNTSTLENKVRDALSAIAILRKQPGLASTPIFLMGASESTLLAAEAASRVPHEVQGLILYGVLASNMRQNFRYIMTDGAFLPLKTQFDTNGDGKVSKEEFEADPHQYRAKTALKIVAFDALDANKDGIFTVDDLVQLRTSKFVEAVDKEDFAVLDAWAKTSAAVAVPENWFKDHFAHEPIWTFLSKLDVPVGLFHGALDAMTPIAAVKQLEKQAKEAGKNKMSFHYFDKLDHSLGIGRYFFTGQLPEGHRAIFEWLAKQVK